MVYGLSCRLNDLIMGLIDFNGLNISFSFLERLVMLRKLNLRVCSLNDKQIGELVGLSDRLEELDLGFCCGVTGEGIRSLGRMLRLRKLDLHDCVDIDSDMLDSLLKLIHLGILNVSLKDDIDSDYVWEKLDGLRYLC